MEKLKLKVENWLTFYYNIFMKVGRFQLKGKKKIFWGIVEGEKVYEADLLKRKKIRKKSLSLGKLRILPPAIPTKIILVGLNYKDHAQELKMKLPEEPLIFMKPPSSLIGHQDYIRFSRRWGRVDYEAELAIVIKKEGRNISPKKAKEYILGYTCLNDVTARDLQKKDGQWTRAKSFDTFCPLGPFVETKIKDPNNLKIKLFLNNKLCQSSSTSNFIFKVEGIISFISSIMRLYPFDIISTGTPPGVGRLKDGDKVEIEIEKIGRLVNYVQEID